MDTDKRKHLETSPHTSFIEYDAQLFESPKVNKQTVIVKFDEKEPIQYFYLRFYLILVLAFSNLIITVGIHAGSPNFLVASITILLLLLMFSMFTIVCEEYECDFWLMFIFKRTTLLIITSIVLVLLDPNTVYQYFYSDVDSGLSSLQTLLLITCLFYRYQFCSIRVLLLFFSLSLFSLFLSLKKDFYSLKIFYEFVLLVGFLVSAAVYTHYDSGKLKTIQGTVPTTGVEEITLALDELVRKMQMASESGETFDFDSVISQLQNVNQALRQSPNIYSAQINSALKGMDEQDKIFIEQACCDSYISNKLNSISEYAVAKDRDPEYCISDLIGFLKDIGKDWNFNTFFIASCTSGFPLKAIGYYTIKRFSLDEQLSIDETVLSAFLMELEEKYLKNPYHNSTHAADVMCSAVYLLSASSLIGEITYLELFSCIIAALAHDVGHPGKNNRFLVISQSNVAIIYNDISVLEMMHASLLFEILKAAEFNILSELSNDKWMLVRKDIIDMILATDMGKHFELLGLFKAKHLANDFHDFSSAETRADLLRLLIKAADIGHAAKSIELHQKWCELVIQEFYDQGDLEKQLNLPVSMYCDRETTEIGKSQSGFIKNIVFPLFSTINAVLSSQHIEEKCVQQLQSNQLFWESYKATERSRSIPEEDRRNLSRIK